MFCDLVGSTQLSQRLDAEEFRELIAAYQGVCGDVVQRFDGHIAQLLGDGVLVYFGYPAAHEDDAPRAIRAALEIQAALEARNRARAPQSPEVRARIGIHSGPVVVSRLGGDARSETLALGDTVNIASRLDSLAEPGGVVASEATLRLASGLFVTRDLGAPPLKGVTAAVRVHAIERVAGVAARHAGESRAPLAGRDRELGLLLDRWEEAKDGRGQVVTLAGEPGIGKSRLLRELRERIAADPHTELDYYCSSLATGSAFQPVVELYEQGAAFEESDDPSARLAKLEQTLAAVPGLELSQTLPYLAALLGLPAHARFPLEHVAPEVQRERTLRALVAPLLKMERMQPLVLLFEDLHWADPSTLELIGRLVEQAPTLRLFVVLTFRPSFAALWLRGRSYVTPIVLTRLGKRATQQLIAACAGLSLPASVLEDIAERADGVPLFAEELVRSVVESGAVTAGDGRFELRGRIAELSIPTTLQSSLMARLDRLAHAKHIAQIGATLGREFSHALIEAVSDAPPGQLARGLEELVAAEVLFRRGTPPDASYTFKHALLQDTAYESQLKSRRRELHARTANALAERFAARVAAEPQVMARHCAEGGLSARAIDHYELAAKQALARLANAEAIDDYGRALDLLATQPESPERAQREISLRLELSSPLMSRGDEHADVVANCERIEALCESLPPGPARLPALVGQAVLHQSRGNLARASRWAHELLEVADALAIEPLQLAAHALIGVAATSITNVHDAIVHLEQARGIAERTPAPPPAAAFDLDLAAGTSGTYAMNLVLAGAPDRARDVMELGLSRARALGHPYTLCLALSTSAIAAQFLEDYERVVALADEYFAVARGRGFRQLDSNVLALRGWARVCLGDAGGAEEHARGVEIASGAGIVQIHVAGAEIALRLGRFDEAYAHADRIGHWVKHLDLAAFAPNEGLQRAEITLAANGDLRDAERTLLETIPGWRRFRSPWMELRSAIALGEVALRGGDRAAARARIEELIARFTEGFETRRLREARRMLVKLGA
jgi:class 3 adenylate cyclase